MVGWLVYMVYFRWLAQPGLPEEMCHGSQGALTTAVNVFFKDEIKLSLAAFCIMNDAKFSQPLRMRPRLIMAVKEKRQTMKSKGG